jgi:hypothetical protein
VTVGANENPSPDIEDDPTSKEDIFIPQSSVPDDDSILDFEMDGSIPTDVDIPEDNGFPSPTHNLNTSSSQLYFGTDDTNRIKYRLVRYKFVRNPVTRMGHQVPTVTTRLRIGLPAGIINFLCPFVSVFKWNEV